MIDLIVDDGIEKRTHRKVLFADHMVCIGVGIEAHPTE
jgi:hypothetical protein